MYLILIGCEYAGTTTLAHAINEWAQESLGTEFKLIHDHYKLPDTKPHGPELTPEDIAAFQQLSPRLTEVIQRHNLYYHTPWASGSNENFMGIGLYFEELVYATKYYGYGGRGQDGARRDPPAHGGKPASLSRRAHRRCRAHHPALRRRVRSLAHTSEIQAGHINRDRSRVRGRFRRQHPALLDRKRTVAAGTAPGKGRLVQ